VLSVLLDLDSDVLAGPYLARDFDSVQAVVVVVGKDLAGFYFLDAYQLLEEAFGWVACMEQDEARRNAGAGARNDRPRARVFLRRVGSVLREQNLFAVDGDGFGQEGVSEFFIGQKGRHRPLRVVEICGRDCGPIGGIDCLDDDRFLFDETNWGGCLFSKGGG